MEPQLGPYPALYPPAGPFPAVGQPHWEPRPPEAPPGPWAPPRGDDSPGHLDPFSQAFASRLPGKAWGAGTPVAGGVTPPPGYLPYSGAPPEEPPPACLYQDLQPPPCAPPAPFQGPVETLLDLACSSALPGGGTNRELALHCLARAGGSLTGALELLLLGTPAWPWADPLAGYHYTGSDAWTPRERRLFAKALARHGKDFTRIQQAVPSKRMTQCVEFYYLYKSRLGQTQKQTPPEALGSRFPCKLCGK
ncbi:transcriptional-regulating factor 1-like [Grus japonensis]|uniref:Transcriptional-regulating factor 1-like n=1 Tax=Grus japonensis TaxID=30415 RepID=A0ABC9XYM2_GRUJA